jgi:zinc protease
MRLARVVLVSALTSLSALSWAQDPRPPELALERSKLPNGLELILHEDHRTPIVTVNLWYHVGSKDEPAGKNGFAHLFEHVMFQGSKHVPEDAYFRDLERVGATSVNGTTGDDRTNYYETVPANQLELALWLESDRMGFLLDHVDQLTFAGQRDVVKNERRQSYENAAYGMVYPLYRAALYPAGHPYHNVTIGTPRDLDAATLDDVRAFFRTWYVPNNATLVVAGDIDKARVKELVEKYFGPIPQGQLPDRSSQAHPQVAPLAGEQRLDVAAGVELPRVYLLWPTPPAFAPEDGQLDLLAQILAGGKTSRLYKRLVYDMQIAQDVGAHQSSAQLGSVFEIVATAQPHHTTEELTKAIDEELAILRASGVRPEELTRAKTITVSNILYDLERDSSRANRINYYAQMAGDPGYLRRDLARYADANAVDLAETARRWLPEGKRVVVVVAPDKTAPISGELRSSAGGKP